jgi:hypothetical protein
MISAAGFWSIRGTVSLCLPDLDCLDILISDVKCPVIFGEHAVHCPNAAQCYCDVYGLCDLDCEGAGVCRDQYTLSRFSTLPEGWPEYDWDGNWQNVTQLRIDQDSM